MKLIVKDIVGPNAISMQSGHLLYEQIDKTILAGEHVELDFEGVSLFASPFFNASIGFLLKDINVDDLKSRLVILNISEVGRQLLNHAIANAIKFYQKLEDQEEQIKIINKNAED